MLPEEIDLTPYIGVRFIAFLTNHEYNNRVYTEVVGFKPLVEREASAALLDKDDGVPF
jgi:hypothetical protein